MSLRPSAARWFETYIPRDQTVRAVEALAGSGVVQLELAPRSPERVDADKLRYFVSRFRHLATRYARLLPNAALQPTALIGDPVHAANRALHRLRIWCARVDYHTQRLAQLHARQEELLLLDECLAAMQAAGVDVHGMFRQTAFLAKLLLVCGHTEAFPAQIEAGAEVVVHGPRHRFVYLAALPERLPQLTQLANSTHGCRELSLPPWLPDSGAAAQRHVRAQRSAARRAIAAVEAQLQALAADAEVAEARANVQTLHWYLEHAARHLSQSGLCHVTGWTTSADPHRLQRVLNDAGIEGVVRFPHAPPEAVVPVALFDNWWTRPFQPLLQMWGTPGRAEVDPSGLLAVIVPLLFGYMFPDLGHGAVLALLAVLGSRRWPSVRFLLPCGFASMAFGWVFGEVFGFHDLLAPLWFRPLARPVEVLVPPLVFGAGVTLLGLVFSGVEARWRGELRQWLMADAAVLLLYVSGLVGLHLPQARVLSLLALLHYFVGNYLRAPGRRLPALGAAAGRLLLSVFELTMNTLSFLRVGAFALAHASVSSAVLSFADATDSTWASIAIVIAGNLLAMVIEGLLVFVQTTRLVLFEFFFRFLQADGRLFRPLGPPQRQAESG